MQCVPAVIGIVWSFSGFQAFRMLDIACWTSACACWISFALHAGYRMLAFRMLDLLDAGGLGAAAAKARIVRQIRSAGRISAPSLHRPEAQVTLLNTSHPELEDFQGHSPGRRLRVGAEPGPDGSRCRPGPYGWPASGGRAWAATRAGGRRRTRRRAFKFDQTPGDAALPEPLNKGFV
jgi:hypothetical protein